MSGWAYRIVALYEFDVAELNLYGRAGWELVTIIADSQGRISRCVFKRPL